MQRVLCDISGGVADVRLNRPDKLNALDDAMFAELIETGSTTVPSLTRRRISDARITSVRAPELRAVTSMAMMPASRSAALSSSVRRGIGARLTASATWLTSSGAGRVPRAAARAASAGPASRWKLARNFAAAALRSMLGNPSSSRMNR